jgi:hypothetical protein
VDACNYFLFSAIIGGNAAGSNLFFMQLRAHKMRRKKAKRTSLLFHNYLKKLVEKKVLFKIFYKEKPSLKSIFADS